MSIFSKAASQALNRCVCSEPHIFAPPKIGDAVVCLSYKAFNPDEDTLKPGDKCTIIGKASASVSSHPYCGVCRKQVMEEWDYYTITLQRDADGATGKRHWQSLQYDVWRGECGPFRRNFNFEDQLSDYEKKMIEATNDFRPVFRIYEEGITGQLRIFWMSNHPWVDKWTELGNKTVYYRTMEHVNQAIDSVKNGDIFTILRFKPSTGFEDVIYGKLLREVVP